MRKSYKTLFLLIVIVVCNLNLQAQTITSYKDVLLNGKPARLNLATGEFTLKDSKGNDSIVNRGKIKHEDFSINRLNFHTVKAGENLAVISKQYGLTLKEIKEANNLETTLVSVGQKLRVRNFDKADQTKAKNVWEVLKGHTLYHISKETGVNITTIKRLNGLKNNNLSIGQKLYLK